MPHYERGAAGDLAREIGARVLWIQSHEDEDERYLENPPNRCYFCKTDVYDELIQVAAREGFSVLVDGTNADDVGDWRPGRQAAREHGVRSPLQEVGFTKDDIRATARELGLPNWDMPSSPCLSSRVPYGTRITPETLDSDRQGRMGAPRTGLPRRARAPPRQRRPHRSSPRRPRAGARHARGDRRRAQRSRLHLRGSGFVRPQVGQPEPGPYEFGEREWTRTNCAVC